MGPPGGVCESVRMQHDGRRAAPSAARRSWGPSWRQAGIPCGVAEEARTRGFAAPAFAGCAFIEWFGDGGAASHQARRRITTGCLSSGMTPRLDTMSSPAAAARGEIPMLLPAGDSTSTPGALAENQVRLLNALARPILVADETGRPLYQSPALRECLAYASVQERLQLQRALDHAVTRLCSRLRNQSDTGASTQPVVLSRQVLTNRSEFRLRGVLVPRAVLVDSARHPSGIRENG